ncbi:NADP-dependent oxidoreductase domain-containing protein, partial [Suillus fuscotomentosus]
LTANNLKYQPAVNQVELNFWNPQPEMLQCSKENGFLLEVYSPLGNYKQIGKSLFVEDIACKLGITPAQVIISWSVQRGTIILPKSMTPSRITENLAGEKVQTFARQHHSSQPVFELPQEVGDSGSFAPSAESGQPERGLEVASRCV